MSEMPGPGQITFVSDEERYRRNLVEYHRMTAGKKYDAGKSPLAQGCFGYFRKALEEVAQVSAYGARKYSVEYADQNWRRVEGAAGRYLDAFARHLAAHASGETHDPESNLRHLAHAAWNALALLELLETK